MLVGKNGIQTVALCRIQMVVGIGIYTVPGSERCKLQVDKVGRINITMIMAMHIVNGKQMYLSSMCPCICCLIKRLCCKNYTSTL